MTVRFSSPLITFVFCAIAFVCAARVAESAPRGPNDFGIPQVAKINEEIAETWAAYELKPSQEATESEWCRRVHLDIIGRIPSVEELQAFTKNRSATKKADLVGKLLYDDKYTEEYARNWTTIWTTVLIGRAGGTERNSLTNREGMQKYLRDCFARNKPYNDMVDELVTATGSNRPGDANFNGAVNFLTMKVNEEKGTQATADVAKIFLGLQVQCTQCHNHPFNEWKQQKFWEFNAFFRQTRALRQFVPGTRDIQGAELVDQDFGGEGGTPETAEIYYELRNGLLKAAYPVFIDDTEIGKSGYVKEVNRRDKLGELIQQSEFMDMCVANRYWSHFFGYGFTKPIDDMGPHNPASHPELLEYLGQQVREHSYNLKELIRWITLSEAYSLSSRVIKANEKDDPLLGETPKFTHFYLRQMQAEELYESLLVATRAAETGGSYEQQERSKAEWLSQFVMAFGTDDGGEATTFNGTIPQALMMFNGELIRNATDVKNGSFLWELANSNMKPAQAIDYLFQAGLARRPTKDEVAIANQLFIARASTGRDKKRVDPATATLAALQDVWWAVLNSNEFIINH
ncbi:MAG: DUF1549 domain-containing protein [Planctomycetaceae bacterium]|nr:DUF1549 domain-containing protein [Planctomycetales bacterium]MCB9923658.1 DUF1549 domain-containing protein [Planctomycetaceae bacterium]